MIREGAKRLSNTPRCDMTGFQPSKIDQQRLEKYIRRQSIESANRQAIREGRKLYDHDHEVPLNQAVPLKLHGIFTDQMVRARISHT